MKLFPFQDVFDENQDYIVFVFDNGGQHLEGAEMKSLKHAKVCRRPALSSLSWSNDNALG